VRITFPCRDFADKKERNMPRGDKSKYTDKQKRQAEHIEEGYKEQGVSENEAESRAWATVNKTSGGGKKSGSGRGKKINNRPAQKGGQKGGTARKSTSSKTQGAGRKTGGTRKSTNGPSRSGTKRAVQRTSSTTAAKRKSSARKSAGTR
jgi:hypothetical protein